MRHQGRMLSNKILPKKEMPGKLFQAVMPAYSQRVFASVDTDHCP
jgi:hypothetical protein